MIRTGLRAADRLKNLRDIRPEKASDRTAPPRIDANSEFGLTDRVEPENFGLDDPYMSANRRVAATLLNEAPPVPMVQSLP